MKTVKLILAILPLLFYSSCEDDMEETPIVVDLEATGFEYELVTQVGCCTGTVRITGKVTNLGTSDYRSASGQQMFTILERPLGTTQTTIVAEQDFNTIAAGEVKEVSFMRNWDITVEFQPEFILEISFDPDILLDGNRNNDDTNSANNSITLAGNDINSVFN